MIIVFGGSFNPPTLAHQHMIDLLHVTFPESVVLILPVGDDYRKPELVSFHHRLNMIHLMTEGMDRVMISDIESKRPWSGTLFSLNELKEIHGALSFVIGADNLSGLFDWIDYKTLLATYPFIVMTRQGSMGPHEAEKMFEHLPHTFHYLNFDEDISSTRIRKHLESSVSLLNPKVYRYILENNLYKEPSHG